MISIESIIVQSSHKFTTLFFSSSFLAMLYLVISTYEDIVNKQIKGYLSVKTHFF